MVYVYLKPEKYSIHADELDSDDMFDLSVEMEEAA